MEVTALDAFHVPQAMPAQITLLLLLNVPETNILTG